MELFVFIILAFLLPILTFRKRNEQSGEILDHKSTTCLKGILCIFVMIHNLGLDYLAYVKPGREFTGFMWVVDTMAEHIGGIAVGVFFFLSAFGLLQSYKKKGNKFLIKLIFRNALKLWLVAVGINLLEYFVFFKDAFETKDAVLRILNLDLFNDFNRMNRHGWFIASLLALYVVFIVIYFACSFLKTKKKLTIASYLMALVPVGFFVYTLIAQHGGMYSREIFCFSLGILYSLYYEKINEFLRKYSIIFIILSAVAYVVGLLFQEETASVAACVFVVAISQKFDYKNPVTEFLGKISLGIYLFLHFSTLVLSGSLISNPWYWMLVNAGFILVLSIALYGIIKLIDYLIDLVINLIKKKNKTA